MALLLQAPAPVSLVDAEATLNTALKGMEGLDTNSSSGNSSSGASKALARLVGTVLAATQAIPGGIVIERKAAAATNANTATANTAVTGSTEGGVWTPLVMLNFLSQALVKSAAGGGSGAMAVVQAYSELFTAVGPGWLHDCQSLVTSHLLGLASHTKLTATLDSSLHSSICFLLRRVHGRSSSEAVLSQSVQMLTQMLKELLGAEANAKSIEATVRESSCLLTELALLFRDLGSSVTLSLASFP